ncbi:MAG: NUDIX domain-containing protein [Halopenitus sp.]
MTDGFHRATVSIRGVIVMPESGLLILRRAADGEWELPGGRLEPDEAVIEGLRREITEETGLNVDVKGPVHTAAWLNDRDEGRFAAHYHCTTEHDAVELSDEHTAFRWVTPADATGYLDPDGATAVERACQQLRFDVPLARVDTRTRQSGTPTHRND